MGREGTEGRAAAATVWRRVSPAWRRRLLVLGGGLAGAALRVGLDQTWLATPDAWPWATFTANMAGAFALGFLLPRLRLTSASAAFLLPLVAVGLLGSLTTFSLFLFEAWMLVEADRAALAGAYIAATLAGGLALALLGDRVAAVRASATR